jgi:hypothetical protein
MAEKPSKPSKSEDKPKKKATETVQLSAEDLRKISGGAINPLPPPKPLEIKKN